MSNKQELQYSHITPFLPYGLTAMVNTKVYIISGIDKPFTLSKTIVKFLNTKNDELLRNIKPILRPLSDLTKEIEVNGEKFVPMVKLLYLYETNYFHENENLKYVTFDVNSIISCDHYIYKLLGSEDFVVKFPVSTSNYGLLIYSFTYDPALRRFAYRNETHKTPFGMAFQLDLFQKLFEWHFDVDNLIPQGLAIDINTINLQDGTRKD